LTFQRRSPRTKERFHLVVERRRWRTRRRSCGREPLEGRRPHAGARRFAVGRSRAPFRRCSSALSITRSTARSTTAPSRRPTEQRQFELAILGGSSRPPSGRLTNMYLQDPLCARHGRGGGTKSADRSAPGRFTRLVRSQKGASSLPERGTPLPPRSSSLPPTPSCSTDRAPSPAGTGRPGADRRYCVNFRRMDLRSRRARAETGHREQPPADCAKARCKIATHAKNGSDLLAPYVRKGKLHSTRGRHARVASAAKNGRSEQQHGRRPPDET